MENREIGSSKETKALFRGIEKLIIQGHKINEEDHKEMKDGIKYTSGDVRALKQWRSFLLGAWAVISVFLTAGGVFFFDTYKEITSGMNRIEDKVDNNSVSITTLNSYFNE